MNIISLILRIFSYKLIYLFAIKSFKLRTLRKVGIWLRGNKYFQNTLTAIWKLPWNLFYDRSKLCDLLTVTPNTSLLLAMLQWNLSDYLRFKCPVPGHLALDEMNTTHN